jgi:hypothetical protein
MGKRVPPAGRGRAPCTLFRGGRNDMDTGLMK